MCGNYALRRPASDDETSFRSLAVDEKFYIDDYHDLFKTPQEILKRFEALKLVLRKGGFKLTKLVSNVEELADELNENTERNEKQNETKGLSHILDNSFT